MKKLLILILIVLLGVVAYNMAFKNIEIGTWKTTNIEELKTLDKDLKSDIEKARELNEIEYTNQIDMLNKSIKELSKTKETYETKIKYVNQENELGVVNIKEYKIEYLWTSLENYAKDNGVWIKLDLVENGGDNLYNLDITLRGSYIGITDVIYDIEKDDTFDFKIEEFKITPSSVTRTTNTPTVPNNSGTITPADAKKNETNNNNVQTTIDTDTNILEATFSIKNVKIELN